MAGGIHFLNVSGYLLTAHKSSTTTILNLIRLLNALSLVFLLASCSSTGQKYEIDQTISKSIDSTFKENVLFDSPIKSEFSFHVVNTFDFEKFKQNGMDLAYFLKGDSYEPSDQYVNSITECYLSKDTIVLVGGLYYESGVVFRMTIFGDKFNTQLFLTATDKIYSKTNSKKDLEKEIIQDADSLSMTLTQKPIFKIGSTIKGKLKLKSKPFYQLDKDDVLFKIDPEFDIIFDIKINEKDKE